MATEQESGNNLSGLTRAQLLASVKGSVELSLGIAHVLENGDAASQQPEIVAALSSAQETLGVAQRLIEKYGAVILNRPAQVIAETQAQIVKETSSSEDLTKPKTFPELLRQKIDELLPVTDPILAEDIKLIFEKVRSKKISSLTGNFTHQDAATTVYEVVATPTASYRKTLTRFSKQDIFISFVTPNYPMRLLDQLSEEINFNWEDGEDEIKVDKKTAFAIRGLVMLYKITQNKANDASRA